MIREAIWTSGASQDYLAANPRLAPARAVDASVELLRLFPEMGAPVSRASRVRRVLVGRKRVYGLYYAINGDRIIVVAMLDLRRDPATIEELLESRGIES